LGVKILFESGVRQKRGRKSKKGRTPSGGKTKCGGRNKDLRELTQGVSGPEKFLLEKKKFEAE